jgi:hypothetical protein
MRTGRARLSFNPANGALFFVPDVTSALANSSWTMPVPRGTYELAIEPVDGTPVAGTNVNFSQQVSNFFGQQNFREQFFGPGSGDPDAPVLKVHAKPGRTSSGLNVVTDDPITIANFGNLNARGFTNSPAGRYYAVQIPAAQIAALPGTGKLRILAAEFDTFVLDASVVPLSPRQS